MLTEAEVRPFTESDIGKTALSESFKIDLRTYTEEEKGELFATNLVRDWSLLTWKDVGKPYEVKTFAKDRKDWEKENQKSMPVHTSWQYFNKSFHEWFVKDVPEEINATNDELKKNFAAFRPAEVKEVLGKSMKLRLWNYIHRIEDGIWDPRGKRAMFEGLHVSKPRILFLGAAEGYEAMQLAAMYPGGEIVMVDYDPFCRDGRFAEFPDHYPFLGENPVTGAPKVWFKNDFNITYLVEDIRNLPFGKEFDIVISVGMIEHFPDDQKPESIDWHRKFLKDGGYAILTTPRAQLKSKLYYQIMADVMNHTYRELMTIQQMGMYIYENGFDILRHGFIKVHNGIIARPR
ncbi:MAG: class I SAM-dependent methyltransferase [Bacillota bacterium]